MSLIDNLPHKCTLRKRTRVQDDLGGHRDVTEDVQTNVECFEQSVSDEESTMFQKMGYIVTHKVYFNSNPNITSQYQILITERLGSSVNESALDVVSVAKSDASAGMGVLWRAMCSQHAEEDL